MKKIEFGFNDDNRLNSQWSGVEFYNGEYLDVVRYDDIDLLITKIIDSPHGLNGKIDVREIAQDYYADGSYVTYANKEKNAICRRLEDLLNSKKIREQLAEDSEPHRTPYTILRNEGLPVYISNLNAVTSKSETVPYIVTSVKPEMFEKLKESKRYNHKSMYEQTQEIMRLQAEIEKLKGNNRDFSTGRHI